MPWGVIALMVSASLAVALFVSWPLLMGRAEPDNSEDEGPADQLLAQKESVYSAIKELEFDHAMGNLSEEDYRELAGRYEDRAVALLQSIDDVTLAVDEPGAFEGAGRGGDMGRSKAVRPEDVIEREIAALRAQRRAKTGYSAGHNLDDEIEAQVAGVRSARLVGAGAQTPKTSTTRASSSRGVCPSCATPVKDSEAAYCSRCGASLHSNCPNCGKAVDAADLFCSGCGTRLSPRESEVEMSAVGGANA